MGLGLALTAQAEHRPTTILDLPSEVLLLILLDVYYAAKAEEHYWDELHITVGNEDAYLKHPAPEYLAMSSTIFAQKCPLLWWETSRLPICKRS